MQETELTSGTLKIGEYHPAANSAMAYIKKYLADDPLGAFRLKEAFASTAISGNRLSEICLETLDRIITGQPVSDRYLLGLAWVLKEMESEKNASDS